MDKAHIQPEQAMQIINQIDESMFGQGKWAEMVAKASTDMKSLLGLEPTSKRDKVIFRFALHMGINYGVAYSHALRKAQSWPNIIRSFFTHRERK